MHIDSILVATTMHIDGLHGDIVQTLKRQNKKVIGKMKDELDGFTMAEFIGPFSSMQRNKLHSTGKGSVQGRTKVLRNA